MQKLIETMTSFEIDNQCCHQVLHQYCILFKLLLEDFLLELGINAGTLSHAEDVVLNVENGLTVQPFT